MRGIAEIRSGALGEDTELLELHFARGLSIDEIAFVLEAANDDVQARLEAATTRAREIVNAGEVDPSLPTALLEAFALEAEETLRPADDSELPTGTRLGSRYVLDAHIGSGAFADVYRASDSEVEDHVVAVKLLKRPSRSEAARERALRELHLIASVFHPSIVHFNDNGWYEDRLWFAMPWYEGESLETRIARAPLTRAEAKGIFVPLARALAAMHAAGIRHQDVKPDNIFLARLEGVGRGGEDDVLPVLLDLGVAAKDAELLLAGTPTYFAPEVAAQFAQMETRSSIGAKADVYSLALSLRNALEPDTAEDVVAGQLDAFIANRAEHTPAPPEAKALRFLRSDFDRWLSQTPAERPNASELAEELAVLTAPEERRARRLRMARIVLPLLIAITSVFLLVGWRLRERAQTEEALAVKARQETAHAQANLEQESSRRQELEGAVARARDRIRSNRLSGEELTQQLAKTEGELEVSDRRVDALGRRTRTLSGQLTAARAAHDALAHELTTAQAATRQARARVDQLTSQLSTAQSEARGLTTRLTQARSALEAAQAQERTARAQAEAQATQTRALTTQLAQARSEARQATQARDRLQGELEAERRRTRQLTQELAQARAAARRPATPGGVQVTPTPPTTMRPPVRVQVGR